MSNIHPLRLVHGDRDDDGTEPIQRCIARNLTIQAERQNVRAIAVAIVDADGDVGHIYYTGPDIAALYYAVSTLQSRILAHGTEEALLGEWDATTIPDGMHDPFLNTEASDDNGDDDVR